MLGRLPQGAWRDLVRARDADAAPQPHRSGRTVGFAAVRANMGERLRANRKDRLRRAAGELLRMLGHMTGPD